MNPSIRGSDVFVKEDLRAQLDALSLAAGGYPGGEFRSGFLAALAAVRASIGLPAGGALECVHEALELRYERTTMRQSEPPAALPERRFAIRGEREEWPEPATQRRPGIDMTGDDVNVTIFNPAYGRLVSREIGHAWFGNDGQNIYYNASEWQRVPLEEARAWGQLVPDGWGVLMRHAYANRKRSEAAGRVRVLPKERGLLR